MRVGTAVALVVVVVTGGIAVWWSIAPDTMPALVKQQLPVSSRSNPTLYRWKDVKGGVHVTDVPPTDRPFETLHYDPNANVVPTVVPPAGTIR